jgi:hypothetical protein
MNHKFMPAAAAFLILGVLLCPTAFTYAVTSIATGPKLEVVTIPQDNPKLETGVIVLGIDPALGPAGHKALAVKDLLSQHKLLVTYNGQPITWMQGTISESHYTVGVVQDFRLCIVVEESAFSNVSCSASMWPSASSQSASALHKCCLLFEQFYLSRQDTSRCLR